MLRILKSLHMPHWLIRCASEEIVSPEFTFDSPCNLGYGFPPAILPIWSDSAGHDYIGVLHHWFGDRMTTFVRYHTEMKRFTEVARTADQLRIWIVFDFLCNVPDFDEVTAFANSTGLCSSDELESFFSNYQKDEDLAQHPSFRGNLPRRFVVDDTSNYSGDFPFRSVDLNRYCGFEVKNEIVNQATDVPTWFDSKNKPELFQELLLLNDQQGAWFCLNSTGWKSSEMKVAIKQLAASSNVNELSLLSDWLIENVPDESTY